MPSSLYHYDENTDSRVYVQDQKVSRVVEHQVESQPRRVVESHVSNMPTTETSGMKLIKTYTDPKYATINSRV